MRTNPLHLLSIQKRCVANSLAGAGFLAIAAIASAISPVGAQQPVPIQTPAAVPAAPQPANMDPKAILAIIRSTLLALDQANKTGNYSVLHDLGSPDFQRDNTVAKLGEIFAGQRNVNLDLAGALVMEPALTLPPQIETNGLLHLAGHFPVSGDARLNFEMFYQLVDNKLKLFGVSVNVAQDASSSPVEVPAPVVQSPAAKQPETGKPKAKPKPKSVVDPNLLQSPQ